MLFINAIKHFCLITKHKWVVFKLCLRLCMPIRGLIHDLSKYSPTEFFESIKYYDGKKSPIVQCKKINGYSKAWLHHKGRNKHHHEYWVDLAILPNIPIIPYKYAAEMICDRIAAGIVYNGKDWKQSDPLEYWNNKTDKTTINEKIVNLLTEVFTQISKDGIKKVMTKKNIKSLYNKHCVENIK